MAKVLIVVAHPKIKQSLGNKTILEHIKTLHKDAEIDELYKLYPDFKIDVKKEQEKLVKADVIILQFPMFWYNCPALLRQWFEDVLTYGFAYGSKGKALQNKRFILSFTTGSKTDDYKEGGNQNNTLEDLLKGLKQLAILCSMKYEGFITTGGIAVLKDPEEIKKVKDRLKEHAEKLFNKINGK